MNSCFWLASARKNEFIQYMDSRTYVFVVPINICFCFSILGGGEPEQAEFELLIMMSSTVEPTSATCQVRTSYLAKEILWGYEFPPIVSLSSKGNYVADLAYFDKVIRAKSPPLFQEFASDSQQGNSCSNRGMEEGNQEKMQLERSYREGEGEGERKRVRVSNV